MWSFSGNVAVFCSGHLIGNLEALLHWAADNYGYQDSRLLNFMVAVVYWYIVWLISFLFCATFQPIDIL